MANEIDHQIEQPVDSNFDMVDTFLHFANSTEGSIYPTYEPDTFRTVIDYLYIYVTPCVISLGVSTNILSFLVFVLTHMRLQSSSVYLAFLAVSDSVFLFATFFSWLSWVRINIVHQTYMCHVVVYLTYISSFLSVWAVVSFTVERYIVVCHPFQRQTMCTVARARIVVISETVFACLFYSYALWTTKIIDHDGFQICGQEEKYINFTRYVSYLDSMMTLVIPSVAIILLNTRITIAIYQFLRNRWTLNITLEESHITSRTSILRLSRSQAPNSNNGMGRPKRLPSYAKRPQVKPVQTHVEALHNQSPQMKTTRMLLIVSAIFVILNLPGHVLRIHRIILVDFMDSYPSELEKRLSELIELLYYLNFSINFFLYIIITRSFREATRRLGARIWHFIKSIFSNCIHCLSGGCRRRQNKDTELHEINTHRHILVRSRPGSRNNTDKPDLLL